MSKAKKGKAQLDNVAWDEPLVSEATEDVSFIISFPVLLVALLHRRTCGSLMSYL